MRQCAKVYFQSNGDTEWAKKSTARRNPITIKSNEL